MDDEQNAVAGEQVRQHGGRLGSFDDSIDRVHHRFKPVQPLNLLDDGRDGGVDRGGTAGDGGRQPSHDASRGVTDEDGQCDGSKNQRKQNNEQGAGGGGASA